MFPPHSGKLYVNLGWYYALCLQELNHILHIHCCPTFQSWCHCHCFTCSHLHCLLIKPACPIPPFFKKKLLTISHWPDLSAHKHIYILVNITGLQPVIIETSTCGDELRTDLTAMEHQMATLGAENIACVLTTTSCFAPRASDSVEQVAVLCSRYNIPHIINNAYGLQSSRCMHLIQEAAR